MSQQPELPIEFTMDIPDSDSDMDYYVMLEDRVSDLARGHTDITGAAATLSQPAAGRETAYIFAASVVVYMRPNNINATEKHDNPAQALKGALDAIERQVRQQRGKLREDRGSLDDLWRAQVEADPSFDEDDATP
ncbi:MAG: hypothetical protein HC915_20830 [Anaerolineae bacterium]|nr:hypothetical protein [Anaerolineae bacterium]